MKKIFFLSIISSCLFGNILFAQQIPNGNMETWDSTYSNYPMPVGWRNNGTYPSVPCYNFIPSCRQTTDRNSGNWAAELKAKFDTCDSGIPVSMGLLVIGDWLNFQLQTGILYSERPAEFNFYYKFLSVGSDTGFAKVSLRIFDSLAKPGPVIGEGKISIINDTNVYTRMVVPINYFRPDTPQLMQIEFSTSKTLSEKKLLSGWPGGGVNPGTTLWIDDISVSGGTLGIGHVETKNEIKIYPNPLTTSSILQLTTQLKEAEVVIYDMLGKEMLRKKMDGNSIVLEKGSLESGVYFVRVSTEERQWVQKVVVE